MKNNHKKWIKKKSIVGALLKQKKQNSLNQIIIFLFLSSLQNILSQPKLEVVSLAMLRSSSKVGLPNRCWTFTLATVCWLLQRQTVTAPFYTARSYPLLTANPMSRRSSTTLAPTQDLISPSQLLTWSLSRTALQGRLRRKWQLKGHFGALHGGAGRAGKQVWEQFLPVRSDQDSACLRHKARWTHRQHFQSWPLWKSKGAPGCTPHSPSMAPSWWTVCWHPAMLLWTITVWPTGSWPRWGSSTAWWDLQNRRLTACTGTLGFYRGWGKCCWTLDTSTPGGSSSCHRDMFHTEEFIHSPVFRSTKAQTEGPQRQLTL